MNRYQEYIRQCRANASHGEFFFAKFILPNGVPTERPVFVISDDNDKMMLLFVSVQNTHHEMILNLIML